ncbi:hypothetical protein CTAYLR_010473 [Chrysophaeum taylorii]|uniref:Tr-type G domain-containing protein n=1 Tax=Chrysophaeum taylorii TaxID=2483200 RepID=A0AAD7XJT7_9STRA|nr:hypothetical protein CTAYLR_010473 [Chrysophaeum taylorii]
MEMLQDPDNLMRYPEVRSVINTSPEGADDDEKPDVVVATSSAPPPPSQQQHEEEEDPREHLNLVFIGHVDAGKSTLAGNVLYLTGRVDKRTIEKFEREAKERNRDSWFLAFIMDTNEEERAKGKTVEVGRATFSTATRRYTILDAPGHKDYVPRMIAGAAQADVGILVVSARRGEFETGFERGGQTREHAMLAKTLGVRYLIVAVNKMDTVGWSTERFDECVTKLKPFLKKCGYTIKKEVRFLALSALNGKNVETGLLACLDSLPISAASPESPLRLPVLARYYDRGVVATGKVETGRVSKGDTVVVMPTNLRAKIDAVFVDDARPVRSAKPGDNVTLRLSLTTIQDLRKGYVLCAQPPKPVTSFTAQIALVDLLEHRPVFTAGYNCILHAHTLDTECTVARLLRVNKSERRCFAKRGDLVIARLAVPQSICIEPFDDVHQLGRLTLRDEGKSIAIGKVLSLDENDDDDDVDPISSSDRIRKREKTLTTTTSSSAT